MGKLRLCTIEFSKNMKVNIANSIKTMKSGDSINIIDLGKEDHYSKLHLCGVLISVSKKTSSKKARKEVSSDGIDNVALVRKNIDKLEKKGTGDRIEWFSSYFPKARIIKIEDEKIFDRLKDTKETETSSAYISSAVELKWNK